MRQTVSSQATQKPVTPPILAPWIGHLFTETEVKTWHMIKKIFFGSNKSWTLAWT